MKKFNSNAKDAIKNEKLRNVLYIATERIKEARREAVSLLDFEGCKEKASQIKSEGISHLSYYLNRFRKNRSEEHTSELQSHSFISYAVFCLKKKISYYLT